MSRLATIELFKQGMGFSAGHFTIFSATSREKLHGHNYQLYVALTTMVADNGLTFDYRDYKQKLYQLCRTLNETFLLAEHSSHTTIEETGEYYYVNFDSTKIPFLKQDATILPLINITVEELSRWFLQHLTADKADLEKNLIQKIVVKLSSSPGQFGSATWEK